MTVTTENSIKALLSSSKEMMLSEVSLIKHTLEKLWESDEAQIYQEVSFKDKLTFVDKSEWIKIAKELLQELENCCDRNKRDLNILKSKYKERLETDRLKSLENIEESIDGLREFLRVLGIILSAFEEDKERQYESLYTGVAELSEILEKYILYFTQDLLNSIRNLVLSFLNDTDLKPDSANQNESVFSCLIRLKNTARAVLWQIEEHRTNETSRFTESPPDTIVTREMQLQKNQAAIEWAKSRLERIEKMSKEKGWNLD